MCHQTVFFKHFHIETLFSIHSTTDGSNQVLPYICLIDYPECETLRDKFHLLLHVSRTAQCVWMCIVSYSDFFFKVKLWNIFGIYLWFFSAGVTDTLLFFKSFLTKTLFIIQSIPDVLNQVLLYIFTLLITQQLRTRTLRLLFRNQSCCDHVDLWCHSVTHRSNLITTMTPTWYLTD